MNLADVIWFHKVEILVIFHQPFHDDFMGLGLSEGTMNINESQITMTSVFLGNQLYWVLHPHF